MNFKKNLNSKCYVCVLTTLLITCDDFFIYTANFPWLKLLFIKSIRSSKVGDALRVINRIAVGLIKHRMQSQQPPKVGFYSSM